jgi:hypothetical protein
LDLVLFKIPGLLLPGIFFAVIGQPVFNEEVNRSALRLSGTLRLVTRGFYFPPRKAVLMLFNPHLFFLLGH